jgi:hypothetical protein
VCMATSRPIIHHGNIGSCSPSTGTG